MANKQTRADYRTTKKRRARNTLLVTGAFLVVVLIVGIYGLISTPGSSPTPEQSERIERYPNQAMQPPKTQTHSEELPAIPASTEPEEFAKSVALALFEWDTYSHHSLTEYRKRIAVVGDPTGYETPGLVSDVDGYLPSDTAWKSLGEYQTRQFLSIEEAFVPSLWEEARRVSPDELVDGMVSYTIEGTRHRSGIWDGEEVASEHPVAFTVFLSCPPATETCAILRLSELDKPLR